MKFHWALLVVLCVHALAQDESGKALPPPEVTQAIWNTALLKAGPKSSLFDKCITAANTRTMQYYEIHSAAKGLHFEKYEVNRFERGLSPLIWDKEIQSNDIIDCSMESKGSLMFQYDGQTCRMANKTYKDYTHDFCDKTGGLEKEVVYVNQQKRGVQGCSANTDVIVGTRGPKCIGGSQQDVPFTKREAEVSCSKHYRGDLYSGGHGVNFTAIRDYLRDKNYQGEFLVDVRYNAKDKVFEWTGSGDFSQSFITVQPREPMYQSIAVISSSLDYLLVMKNNTELITGYICLGVA